MPTLIGALLTLASLVVVTYPFVRRASAARASARVAEIERLERAQADLYHQIGELRADHDAGSVSDEDYRTQLRELRVAAAQALRALDRAESAVPARRAAAPAAADAQRTSLELEIAALRAARARRRQAREETS